MTKKLSDKELGALYHAVQDFDMEIGSGASFEQYFRWAEPADIKAIVGQLHVLELVEIAETTQLAIDIAFPDGIPSDPLQKSNLTQWSPIQEKKLDELYSEKYHAPIAKSLEALEPYMFA